MSETAALSDQDKQDPTAELQAIFDHLQQIQTRLDALGEPLTAAHLDMAINALENALAVFEQDPADESDGPAPDVG